MDQFLKDHSDIAIAIIICAAVCFLGLIVFAFGAVGKIGQDAFAQGSNPKSPEAFSTFAVEFSKISVVAFIIMATVVLSTSKHLDEGSIGILSGIAGYVLGGVRADKFLQAKLSNRKLKETSDSEKNNN